MSNPSLNDLLKPWLEERGFVYKRELGLDKRWHIEEYANGQNLVQIVNKTGWVLIYEFPDPYSLASLQSRVRVDSSDPEFFKKLEEAINETH